MLRLTTFDGVTLSSDGGAIPAIASRRLSVALLLVLALRGSRGITRDALMELLWPDDAVKNPRHSLDQLLTVTRSLAGEPELFAGTSTLTLRPGVIQTDVDLFESARRDQRIDELARLYRAPFADGFSFSASPALEELIDNARTRFAIEHAAAVRVLAERAETRDDWDEAARWWGVVHETDPLDGAIAERLIKALASGNRQADALRVARATSASIKSEFGREDPEILRWITRLEDARKSGTSVKPALQPDGIRKQVRTGVDGLSPLGAARPPADAWLHKVIGGRYRLEKIVRAGRIATVYVAVDTQGAGALVEVQVMEPPVAACMPADHFAEVFGRVLSLSHPNVLPTFDAGCEGSLRYIVTASGTGKSLHERLRQSRALPIPEAVALASDMAAALAHAHSRGVRHGDLRPKCIMLSSAAIVTSFGLADSIKWGLEGENSAILTLGSTVYHSPEQLMGEATLDAASDVYALGCILFEMLAGEPPFGGPTRPNRMLKVSQTAPSVREFRETVPEALAEIVRTCLARMPVDRYGSGVELSRALHDLSGKIS